MNRFELAPEGNTITTMCGGQGVENLLHTPVTDNRVQRGGHLRWTFLCVTEVKLDCNRPVDAFTAARRELNCDAKQGKLVFAVFTRELYPLVFWHPACACSAVNCSSVGTAAVWGAHLSVVAAVPAMHVLLFDV